MAFLGGSAYAMARDVGEGFVLISPVLLKRMTDEELRQLRFEIDRILTGIRSEQYPMDDQNALGNRNRRISRLNSAVAMINNWLLFHR
jgi:hypothetical protein